jgi:hypothetical protein
MEDQYFINAWIIYLSSSVVFVLFWWWSWRKLNPCWLRAMLITAPIAVLFTPKYGNSQAEYWVPAVITAGFQGLAKEWLLVQETMIPILVIWGITSFVGILLCFIFRKKAR